MKRIALTLIAVLMLSNAAFAADATSVAIDGRSKESVAMSDSDASLSLSKESVAIEDEAATPEPTSVATGIDLTNVPPEFHWLAIFWYMFFNGTVL